jgi:hypothetical protein
LLRGRSFWLRWKAFAHRVATVQARVLLGLMYFTVLLPFAMLLRLQSTPFRESGWQKHDSSGRSEAEAAQRQF